MEKALASMHQARLRHPVSLEYGSHEGQIGLFVRCHAADRDAVMEPIVANYPQAAVTLVEEGSRGDRSSDEECDVWFSDVQLVPELFPILRHAQFEDALQVRVDKLGGHLFETTVRLTVEVPPHPPLVAGRLMIEWVFRLQFRLQPEFVCDFSEKSA